MQGFIEVNSFEYAMGEISAIFFRGQWVNSGNGLFPSGTKPSLSESVLLHWKHDTKVHIPFSMEIVLVWIMKMHDDY